MARVHFTSALKRFFPNIKSLEVNAESVSELISGINQVYPGIKSYLLEDDGSVRKHVNIFIGDQLIEDELKLTDKITEECEIHIFQALSGG